MSHAPYQDLFSAFLDGVLSPEEEAELKAHLDECPECREELEKLRQTVRQLQALPLVPLPADFTQNMRRRLTAEGKTWASVSVPVRKPKSLPRRLSKSPWISLAAAAAVVLMVWTAFQPPQLSVTQPDLAAAPAAQEEAAATGPAMDDSASYTMQAAAEDDTAAANGQETPAAVPAEKRAVAEKPAAAEKTEAANAAPAEADASKLVDDAATVAAAADAAPPAEDPVLPTEQVEQTLAAAAIQAPAAEESAAESLAEASPAGQVKAADDGSRAMVSAAAGPKIIRAAQLTLTAVQGSREEITAKLAAAYTMKSAEPATGGPVTFLVPIESWDKAMILLEELGDVSDLTFSDNDISEEYEITSEHLLVLRQEAAALEGMLAEDLEAADRQDLEIQLHQLETDASSLEAQLAYMDGKAANIDVRLNIILEKTEISE